MWKHLGLYPCINNATSVVSGDSQLSLPLSLLTTLSEHILFVTAKPDLSGVQRLLLARTTGHPQGFSLNLAGSSSRAGVLVSHVQWRVRTCRRTRSRHQFPPEPPLGQLNMRHYSHSGAGVAWETSITSQMLMRVPKSPSPHQTDRLVRTRAARGTSTGSQMTQKLSKGHAPPSVQSHPKCRLMPGLGRSRAERGVLG